MTGDTILAVASAPGRSARGVLRLSGPGTFELLRPFVDWGGRDPARGMRSVRLVVRASEPANLTAEAGRPCSVFGVRCSEGGVSETPNPEHRTPNTLPCLALIFVAPASYTGEDAVELLTPGNPTLLERIIDMLLNGARQRGLDARRAEPGEFTARAFMNGRISLAGAEGVAAIIAARCDAQLAAARHLEAGRLAGRAQRLADDLAGALALVEAGIDFTDQEDVVPVTPAALLDTLGQARDELASILDHAVGTESLESLPWVVLTGPPNAGKSTLFNALLGRQRAIVSAVAGVTRDVIAEPLPLPGAGGGEIMLVDVAGADTPHGALDRAMQARTADAIARAELRLECVPIDAAAPERAADGRTVVVRTMVDRRDAQAPADVLSADAVLSAVTGAGLDELRSLIARRIGDHAVSLAADAVVVQPRHEAALAESREALDAAITLLAPCRTEPDLPEPELIAAAMRAALDALGAVTGEVTPDDVLGRVFATFCVGK